MRIKLGDGRLSRYLPNANTRTRNNYGYADTYYNNVKVVGEMIRQDALAHFLFRHPVEPVVLLPLFVRLCAFLGLRKLRSEKKEQTQRGLNNTAGFLSAASYDSARKACNYFSRSAGDTVDFFRVCFLSSRRPRLASPRFLDSRYNVSIRDIVTQCYVLYWPGIRIVNTRE